MFNQLPYSVLTRLCAPGLKRRFLNGSALYGAPRYLRLLLQRFVRDLRAPILVLGAQLEDRRTHIKLLQKEECSSFIAALVGKPPVSVCFTRCCFQSAAMRRGIMHLYDVCTV
jgi:hypothetical protein